MQQPVLQRCVPDFDAFGQDFTLGANLALGSKIIDKRDDDASQLIGLPDSADVSVYQITVLLGFNFGFGE